MATNKDVQAIQRNLSTYFDKKGPSSDEDIIAQAAAKALSKLPKYYNESLPDLIVRLNKDQDPPWVKPNHLAPLIDAFDRIQAGERVRFLLSVPPRHSKSFCVMHGIIRYFLTHKNKKVIYICYNQELAEEQSRHIRERIVKAGLKFVKDSNSVGTWKLDNGCTFRATGIIGGNVTGYGADLIVVDDPFKERSDVESPAMRDKVYNAYMAAAVTRLAKATIVISTRWHADDLIGRLAKLPGYEYVNLPAINEAGEALWPEVRPLSILDEAKSTMNIYDWSSLFMGNPVPRGHSLFNELPQDCFYSELPSKLRYSVGIDFAYTAKTHADYSVAVVMATDGYKCYVVDVIREQCDATKFAATLKKLRQKYLHPHVPFLSYIGGPEKGTVSLLNSAGLNLIGIPARTDKFDRAQAASAAWNNNKILLPLANVKWKSDFVVEVGSFSGLNDPHDDQVDAFAAAYAGLSGSRVRRNLTNLPSA